MMVIVILAASVISAFSLNFIFSRTDAKRVLFGIILGVLFIVEFLPRPIPRYPAEIPEYISVLKNSPEKGSLFDTVTPMGVALYHQTLHGKPLTIGYISRHSTSSFNEFQKKMSMLRQQNYASLSSEYQVKYVMTKSPAVSIFYPYQLTLVHKGKKYSLLAINNSPGDTLFSNSIYVHTPFKGSIDQLNNKSIAGWAIIPGLNTKTATISLLLSDGTHSKIIATQKKMRPDVSEFHKMPGLYDHSGFFAEIPTRDLPSGTYRIGILIDNEGMKTFRWSSTNFVSE
jgi:hypothetical protein